VRGRVRLGADELGRVRVGFHDVGSHGCRFFAGVCCV
jgi:hypothetical protein